MECGVSVVSVCVRVYVFMRACVCSPLLLQEQAQLDKNLAKVDSDDFEWWQKVAGAWRARSHTC